MTGATARELNAERFKGDATLKLVLNNLRTLLKGSKGEAVKKVQRALIDAGFPLPKFGPDGDFGAETEGAVKAFQASVGFVGEDQDGKVGPLTLGKLDEHFATQGEAPTTGPGPGPASPITFDLADPQPARYPAGDPFVSDLGGAIRLDSTDFVNNSSVTARGADESEAKKWEVGHVQDLVSVVSKGTYENGRTQSFVASFPIRDAILQEPRRFPWFRPSQVRPVKLDTPVLATHLDQFPGAQFVRSLSGSPLVRIDFDISAIDWVTARNKHTGETRFLHHVEWGSKNRVVLSPNLKPGDTLPDPVGTLQPITQGPGQGRVKPSMTEAIFNTAAKLVIS